MHYQLFFVALFACAAVGQLANCRAPGQVVIGGTSQCDMTTECDWCERNHLSFDFLCCESGKWIGPHLTNPLIFYLVWNSVPWTIILVLAFEAFEVLIMTILGSFELLFADKTDSETLAGALLGDVILQGGLGLFIGYLLRIIFLAPTLVSSPERAQAYDHRGRRRVYIIVYLLVLITFLLPGRASDDGVRWGLMVQTGILLVFVWIVYPFAFVKEYDARMLWQQGDGSNFGGWRKFGFFFLWGVTILLAHAPHFATEQPSYAYNEWYQNWLLTGPWMALLLIVAFGMSIARHDGYTAWILAGVAMAIVWLSTWSAYHITQTTSDTLIYVGFSAFVVAAIFFAIGAFVEWPNTTIPHAKRGRTDAAVAATRHTSRTPVGGGGGDNDDETAQQPLITQQTRVVIPSSSSSSRARQRRVHALPHLDFD